MSKIFEALKKAETEGAEIPLGFITQEQIAPAAPSAAAPIPVDPVQRPGEPAAGPTAEASEPPRLGPQGRVARIRLSAKAPLFPFDGGHSRAAEQYRIVRTKIGHHPDQPRMIVVSSAGAGDGKTVTAVNIAGALALKNDVKVLLADADFRRSSISALLGLPATPGLAGVLAGCCTVEEAMIRIEQFPNLHVLPGGKRVANPVELLDSDRWRATCAFFRKQFRFTIFDAPPIAAVADYDLIQMACDGVIFVARPDHTNRTLCSETLEAVPKEKLIGAVINSVDDWFLWKSHDYYYYADEVSDHKAMPSPGAETVTDSPHFGEF